MKVESGSYLYIVVAVYLLICIVEECSFFFVNCSRNHRNIKRLMRIFNTQPSKVGLCEYCALGSRLYAYIMEGNVVLVEEIDIVGASWPNRERDH